MKEEKNERQEHEVEDEEYIWDDVSTVSFEFIKVGNSTLDGLLTTHDRNYKVTLQRILFSIFDFFPFTEIFPFLSTKKTSVDRRTTSTTTAAVKGRMAAG